MPENLSCPDCGYDLTQKVVAIESFDDTLVEYSGVYCPRCLVRTLARRAPDFDRMVEGYAALKRGVAAAEPVPA